MNSLESPFLHFECDPEKACWSLVSQHFTIPEVRMAVRYRVDGRNAISFDRRWERSHLSEPTRIASSAGNAQQITAPAGPDAKGLTAVFEFVLSEEYPALRWKVTLRNQGSRPLFIDRIEMLGGGGDGEKGCKVQWNSGGKDLGFYANGWQSWSYSGTYLNGQRTRRSRLGPLQTPMVINPGTPVPSQPGHFAADFFGVLGERSGRRGLIAGFLSQRQHFGSIETRTRPEGSLRMWANGDGARLDPGEEMSTDWAALWSIDLDDADPLGPYFEAVARENRVGPVTEVPVGWCSWYHFYQKVTAVDIERNLNSIVKLGDDLPVRIFQIDDGFEKQVGDWFEFRPSFPEGVAPLAEKIRQAGKAPGLWLAPFIVHPRSDLAKKHPEWILRGANGKPVNAGYVWDSFTQALDLTVPEALEYACRSVHTAAHEWGFKFIKLDFLYAAALPGRHRDPSLTRAQVLRRGLEALRQAAGPETDLLGCGVPLGTSVGLFQSMRISSDVNGDWLPTVYKIYFPFKPEPHMPALRNSLQNVLARAAMHKRWWINDPDCLLARPDTRLTRDEVRSMATAIALTGGTLLISDDLPEELTGWLRIPQLLLPVIGQRAQVPDWFDSQTPRRLRVDLTTPEGDVALLALFNWSETGQKVRMDLKDYGLPVEAAYLARSFWEERSYQVEGGSVDLGEVPAHGVALMAVRKDRPGRAQYLGSNLHISQGMEISEWREEENRVTAGFDLGRHAKGEVELKLPGKPVQATLAGAPLEWKSTGEGMYSLPVEFSGSAEMVVEYEM